MEQDAIDALNGDGSDPSTWLNGGGYQEALRLGRDVSEGPSMAPHSNPNGSTSMRIAGVNVPMAALAFVAVGLVVMIAAGR